MSAVVLVTSRSFGSGTFDGPGLLSAAGYRVIVKPPTHDLADLADTLPEAVAWIAGTGPIGADHFATAPALRILARYGVGVDAVDLAAAVERGIPVTNTPGANSESVADLALTSILAGLRGISAGDAAVRRGDWGASRGREISGQRIGIVGFGRIGRALATRVIALGADVLAFDPYLPADAPLPDRVTRAHALSDLASCAAVSLHSPGGEQIIGPEWLALARESVLVNTARADLVDEAEVAAALRAGGLAAYHADTLGSESAETSSPLLSEDLVGRVCITPHWGAQTIQAIDRMTQMSTEDVLAVLAGRVPAYPVTS
ncbi:hydroxyacid dehydrogenase [Microbacterium sp. zg.B48]|uniref:NAD(P)-dependent oxidoreductase n=1 Tax=Microbacterium sp. zg.B48 TaxID=2969408 RepID=UPI00214C4A6B|nr:NAD(P)-dependent oxidoreductase [Microbacterium sp. zg.B48]MCR2762822.1 hydroxyacid dehydrogenase [Microbacterium sp. zg.B48]